MKDLPLAHDEEFIKMLIISFQRIISTFIMIYEYWPDRKRVSDFFALCNAVVCVSWCLRLTPWQQWKLWTQKSGWDVYRGVCLINDWVIIQQLECLSESLSQILVVYHAIEVVGVPCSHGEEVKDICAAKELFIFIAKCYNFEVWSP